MMSVQDSNPTGLIIVYTGDGKGKTTAALGLALRACGCGKRVSMLQFVKGTIPTGEVPASKHVPGLEVLQLGKGFIETDPAGNPIRKHMDAAKNALQVAMSKMESGKWDMMILDEVNLALSRGLLDRSEVEELLERKPPSMTVVLTGRGAPSWLIDTADLVTDMKAVKHPFSNGAAAQPGIEY